MKFRQGIHVLFLLVFAAAGAQGQINTGGGAVANRLFKGSGIPSSGCATAGDVNKVYVQGNVLATTSPLYICSEVSSGVYAWVNSGTSSGGSGTLTNFASGNLSPLFTTSVATPTTTPSQTFSLSNAAQNSVFAGPASGGAGAPSYQLAPTFSGANITGIPNAGLNNSAITIGGTSVALGGSTTSLPNPGPIGGTTPNTGAFTSLSTGSSPPSLTAGTGGVEAFGLWSLTSTSGPTSGTGGSAISNMAVGGGMVVQ